MHDLSQVIAESFCPGGDQFAEMRIDLFECRLQSRGAFSGQAQGLLFFRGLGTDRHGFESADFLVLLERLELRLRQYRGRPGDFEKTGCNLPKQDRCAARADHSSDGSCDLRHAGALMQGVAQMQLADAGKRVSVFASRRIGSSQRYEIRWFEVSAQVDMICQQT